MDDFGTRVIIDEGEVTLTVPGLSVLGWGDTLEEAERHLIAELSALADRVGTHPDRYRIGDAQVALLGRFKTAGDEERHAMLAREPV